MKVQSKPQTESGDSAASTRLPTREIRLEMEQATRWLTFLESTLTSSSAGGAIERFCHNLSEACWLARWKREYVLVDIDLALAAELLEVVLSRQSASPLDIHCEILEEISKTLVRIS